MTGTDGKQKHGLFTYHLLKALNDYKGKATIQELYDALSPRVQDAARRDNRSQTPQLHGRSSRADVLTQIDVLDAVEKLI